MAPTAQQSSATSAECGTRAAKGTRPLVTAADGGAPARRDRQRLVTGREVCAPYDAIYAATKAGLIGLSLSVGLELDDAGVTIGTVCPGFVSEAGMWANTGGKTPRMLREVSPQRCANAVLKVIAGSPQELVSSVPIRPFLALAELAPTLHKPILKRLGVLKAFRDRAMKLASDT